MENATKKTIYIHMNVMKEYGRTGLLLFYLRVHGKENNSQVQWLIAHITMKMKGNSNFKFTPSTF